MDQALENSSDKQKPLVVLTFDDGDIGLFYHLLPLVQSERLPVTVYISTGQIESGQPYWFDRIMNALQRPEKTIIDLTDHGLRSWLVGPETGVSRWAIISDILETLKSISPSGRKVLVEKIIEQAGSAISGFTPIAPMSIKQLKSLAEDPLVTIGAHSHCHNLLNQIPLDQARASIQMSRTLLETWTDQEIRHFAYPNGSHTTELQAELAQQGFISATVLDAELATLSMNRFALSRVGVGRYDTLNRFKLKLVKI
ncbi:MAG: polysaccharide deacetylase family protein [Hyphomicrobiales bacterium]